MNVTHVLRHPGELDYRHPVDLTIVIPVDLTIVIPAKAGIQESCTAGPVQPGFRLPPAMTIHCTLDSGCHRNDDSLPHALG
jgi:hypothetical protein